MSKDKIFHLKSPKKKQTIFPSTVPAPLSPFLLTDKKKRLAPLIDLSQYDKLYAFDIIQVGDEFYYEGTKSWHPADSRIGQHVGGYGTYRRRRKRWKD